MGSKAVPKQSAPVAVAKPQNSTPQIPAAQAVQSIGKLPAKSVPRHRRAGICHPLNGLLFGNLNQVTIMGIYIYIHIYIVNKRVSPT